MKQQREYPLWYIMIKLLKLVKKKKKYRKRKRNIQFFTYYHFLIGYFLEVTTLANRASEVRALHKGSLLGLPMPNKFYHHLCYRPGLCMH